MRISTYILCFLFSTACYAQSLSHVSIKGGLALSYFAFTTDQQVIIKISPDGKLLEYGMEVSQGRFYNQPGRLEPYMGRVEKYGPQYDAAFVGKVKSIGTCNITYYNSYDKASLAGKIRSIGSVFLDYYEDFDNEAFAGKLRTAGSVNLGYYSSFENEAYRGKLKSVRNNQLTYHSSFDDKAIRGKIKSIGNNQIEWYTSMDRRGYGGSMKSGSLSRYVDGIQYIIW